MGDEGRGGARAELLTAERAPAPLVGAGRGGGSRRTQIAEFVNARPEFHQSQPDRLEHAVQITVHILIGEAQNVESLGSERGRARGVAVDLFVRRMSRPVDLDDHPRVKAGEVGDEASENDLAAEAEAGDLLPSEALPKPALGAGILCGQRARAGPRRALSTGGL